MFDLTFFNMVAFKLRLQRLRETAVESACHVRLQNMELLYADVTLPELQSSQVERVRYYSMDVSSMCSTRPRQTHRIRTA